MKRGCCSSRQPITDHAFTVTYDSENHFQVLFQCWGSVWPRVLPYCLFNVILAAILHYSKDGERHDYGYTGKGHSLLTMIVSFLLVSRIGVSYGRYCQVRNSLEKVITSSQQLIHLMSVFTSDNITQNGKEFRHDMAFLTMTQVRCIMCVMDYQNDKVASWDLPEIDPQIAVKLREQLFLNDKTKAFAHHSWISKCEENMRVPIRLALLLRKQIMSQSKKLEQPLIGAEENRMLGTVDAIMNAYYEVRGFLTAPFPFPLVQMSRTFLFVYLFTIPFAFLNDVTNPIGHYIVIFFITYGYLGLEFTAIELDDPFGDDDNDFNNSRLCCFSFEDMYLTILDIDGEEWTDKLRKRFNGGKLSEDLPIEAEQWLRKPVEV
eukprot:CAMPEP_0194147076 /NCGR_PEP_ID=MMETSP0152-20130528/22509_1 /TAXON_ID=1049557 /ORGANISM="Thalassiothrix antarctica, Strain L6-D1" /LENGTH=375 /DNA_ID=CAMNT_0038847765 /DNA_START=70 /DNA_END=1197 /DNA_ORIENTATION=-